MMKNRIHAIYFSLLLIVLTVTACTKEKDLSQTQVSPKVNLEPLESEDSVIVPDAKENKIKGKVEFFNKENVADGYILVNDIGNSSVYLMDKTAKVLHEWSLSAALGNDAYLHPNGKLLASLKAEDREIKFGGSAGKIQLIDKNGDVEWNFDYSSGDYITHHDAEILPNGNVLALVWERRSRLEAKAAGSNLEIDIFPEVLIEIDPTTDQIVWQWKAWNHLVQDIDETKENYGVVVDNPQLINLNYVSDEKGDIMHANGISYDPVNDLIFISVNFYHEVWVIDHGTTNEESATNSGGNYGKGGDLVYRFGNPQAYNSSNGNRLFRNNHYPNLLKGTDEGKMLIFTNGAELEKSTVYELQLPKNPIIKPDVDNEPKILWSFSDPELFAPKVSGAVKLPNGNVLITEGDYGIWEVTKSGEVVWKFSGESFFWRAYHYDVDSEEIRSLDL